MSQGPELLTSASWPSGMSRRALDDLRLIRETMDRATAFKAVPGIAGVLIGLTALPAAWLAARQPTPDGWLLVWLGEAGLAILIGLWSTARKARALGLSLFCRPARRLGLSFLAPMVAGALLTVALYRVRELHLLAGLWLLLYGTGAVTGGIFSWRVLSIMGFAFMGLGAVTLMGPPAWRDALMALGFGGLHVVFGAIVAWEYKRALKRSG